MKLTLKIDVHFEDGRVENNAQATDLLAGYVKDIGQHTVATKVEGTVECEGRKCGSAKFDGKLYNMPEAEDGKEEDNQG